MKFGILTLVFLATVSQNVLAADAASEFDQATKSLVCPNNLDLRNGLGRELYEKRISPLGDLIIQMDLQRSSFHQGTQERMDLDSVRDQADMLQRNLVQIAFTGSPGAFAEIVKYCQE